MGQEGNHAKGEIVKDIYGSREGNHAKEEIVKDIYGSREGNSYEYGIAGATDAEHFTAKLESLQSRWEVLCPGFFAWFIVKKISISGISVSVITRKLGHQWLVLPK